MTVMSRDWNTVTLTPTADATFVAKIGKNECRMTMPVHEDSLILCHMSLVNIFRFHASTRILFMQVPARQDIIIRNKK